MTATPASIVVQSDTSSLLGLLAKTFTRKTTVLSELLQNARRARASSVVITISDKRITVSDDGTGIADASLLLAVARSGWDDAVRRTDSPYGAGFLATLFCCDRVEVRSRGFQFGADTTDLLALRPAALNPCNEDGRTTITLQGHKLGDVAGLIHALKKIARGFPIPVMVNGESIERPDAVDQREFRQTAAGAVSMGVLEGRPLGQMYLQGLPIDLPAGTSRRFFGFDGECMHLDGTQFFGRMPDRDCLIDPEDSAKRINAAINEAVVAHLTKQASALSQKDFIARYGVLAAEMDMRDVLNGIPMIPAQWVSRFYSEPILQGANTESCRGVPDNQVITREALERSGLFDPSTDDLGEETLVAEQVVHATEGFLNETIPQWHWASALVRELGPEDCEVIPGKVIGEGMLEVYGCDVTLRLVESLTVKPVAGDYLPDAVPLNCHFDPAQVVLWATEEACSETAVMQVSCFEDDDIYEEDRRDEAANAFWAMLQTLKTNDPALLLRNFLRQGMPCYTPEHLKGRAFKVVFDQEGRVEVALQE